MNRTAYLAFGAALVAAPLAFAAAPAAPTIAAAPLHSEGIKATYPRLTKFPDSKIMAKVNAALAGLEKTDRQAYVDCLAQLKEMKMKPDKDTYVESVDVVYLSAHFLSVDVTTSYFCAGAYPTNGAKTPVTYDLSNGTTIDWSTQFKPGFLSPLSDAEKAPPSWLTKIYRARYAKTRPDAECKQLIAEMDPFSGAPIIWLDGKGGVVFQPDFPHATQACADPITLTPAQVAPYLNNAALAADLKATVHK